MKILLYVLLLSTVGVLSKSASFHHNQKNFLFDLIKSSKDQILDDVQTLVAVGGPYINSDSEDESDVNAPIMELAYYGSWYSDSNMVGSQFNYFSGNNGYSVFVADDEHSDSMNDVVYFTFFDGQYIDQKAAQVNFWYDNATDFDVANSTFHNTSITFSLTYYNNLKEVSTQNCTGGYQLSFVDSAHNNVPYNVTFSQYNDAVAYFWLNSTDCNINVTAIVAANDSSRESKALYYAIMVTIICLVHLFAAVQMIKNLTQNENEGIRYSLITLSFFAIWDVFMCLFHLYDALTTEDYFHYFIIPAFWYFILSSIFETRLILVVWKTKYYHTFQSPSEVRRGIAVFYVKFYGAMLLSLFLAYTFLPATWFFGMTSAFFIPQIAHVAIRGQKYKFDPVYAFLLGFIRILVPVYAKGCPASLFRLTPINGFIIFYICFVAFQIFVMYLQSKLGSRFFIPKCFLPPKYNYYYKLATDSNTDDDPETCAICMENLTDAPVSSSAGLLNRKPKDVTIMVTPCRHKFHPSCLRQWMEIKLECPFCRAPVPSLE